MDKETYSAIRRCHLAEAELSASLEAFGDAIAEREGYSNLSGLDAVHFYLIRRFHWLPSAVRNLSHQDLRFVLHQEMQSWTLPEELRD